jgi:phosphoribosylformylglycinamidine (FGAM) synthase-like enzyme
LREAVEGVAQACRAFGTPVTGGNVSLYNESPAGVVDPTPTVAMVGLIEDEGHITTQWFKSAGDAIILVGSVAGVRDPDRGAETLNGLGGSHFLKVCHGLKEGPPPHVDLTHEIKVQNAVRDLIHERVVRSAHDCSEGGLAVALAECCFNPENLLGANVDLDDVEAAVSAARNFAGDTPAVTLLFNESQSRILISVAADNFEKTMSLLHNRGVPFQHLGKVGGDELRICVNNETFSWPIADLHDDWFNAIRRAVEDDAAERIPSL